ncbi:hypothetical protein SS50377_21031 [Spironucleus salmonicida]|uniref:Uncharacterized protein n=1 Tax=Spironucleus salmonicida TaxID=348837 RepID=V6LGR1_9EUKA|nr:hypothetical protein SS50377_21031 [Spironucleus salmonicida]|eukprot:EST43692.1 hypothetical protein SS50377_16742 [Spironucleus salmonicida]
MFKADDEKVTESIKELVKVIDDQYSSEFSNLFNVALNQANEDKDVEPKEEYKNLLAIFPKQLRNDTFDLLTIACYSSLVNLIPIEWQPLSIIDKELEQNLVDGVLKYLNNWFGQRIGMVDCRTNFEKYIKFINKYLNTNTLSVFRIYLAISRIVTKEIEIEYHFIQEVINCCSFVDPSDKEDKLYKASCNIICGSIGKVLLTLKKFDVTLFNAQVVLVKKMFLPFVDMQLPCVQDLQQLISWKQIQDDSDMY